MNKTINRRKFIKKSTQFGLAAAVGTGIASHTIPCAGKPGVKESLPDISVVTGADYFQSTMKAVEALGGMEKVVEKDAKVALLPNAQRWNPGTFTKPEILRAVIQMCKKAEASEVNVLSWLGMKNWESTGLAAVINEEGANLKLMERDEANFKLVEIPNGVAMKDALIIKELYNNDVFIDMPITKDHAGNKFTGTMKNLMGINFPTHNRSNFHKENWTTDPDAISHLDQCIVDLNTVVKPDLCITDGTEFIITNGPMGPGEIIKPLKVVAGYDRVAMDAYCTTLWDIAAEDIIQITHASERGLGTMDLRQVAIKEIQI